MSMPIAAADLLAAIPLFAALPLASHALGRAAAGSNEAE
jgi:multisubunit Na+/H+ antiporter MnhG subunit